MGNLQVSLSRPFLTRVKRPPIWFEPLNLIVPVFRSSKFFPEPGVDTLSRGTRRKVVQVESLVTSFVSGTVFPPWTHLYGSPGVTETGVVE